MKDFTEEEKFTIVERLSPWVKPAILKKEFPINDNTLYYYQRRYGILNYTENMGRIDSEFERAREDLIQEHIQTGYAVVRELLEGDSKD